MAPRVDRAVRSLPCQSSIPGRYDLLRTTRKERLEPHRATHDLRVRGLAYHPNLRPTAKRGHMRPAEDGRRVAHLCIAPSPRMGAPSLRFLQGWAAMLPAQLLSVLHRPLCMPSSYPSFSPTRRTGHPHLWWLLQFESRATRPAHT